MTESAMTEQPAIDGLVILLLIVFGLLSLSTADRADLASARSVDGRLTAG